MVPTDNIELSLVPEILALGLDHTDIDQLGADGRVDEDELQAFRQGVAERSTESLNPYFSDELRDLPQYAIGARVVTRIQAKGAEQ